MNTSAYKGDSRVKSVSLSDVFITVDLMDGRIISVPLIFYPRLYNATASQRNNWKISGGGYAIH